MTAAAHIPAVVFTFAGDARALQPQCKLHRRAGLAPVIVEDAAAPLPPWCHGWLAKSGIELRRSTFPRRGNLNGTECAAGIARELAEIVDQRGAPYAIKVDADTVVLDPSIFEPAARGMVGLTWRASGRVETFGVSYALSPLAARQIAETIERDMVDDPGSPEDKTIWLAAVALGIERAEIDFCAARGAFSALPDFADPLEACGRFAVVTAGNLRPDGARSIGHAARAMRRLLGPSPPLSFANLRQ